MKHGEAPRFATRLGVAALAAGLIMSFGAGCRTAPAGPSPAPSEPSPSATAGLIVGAADLAAAAATNRTDEQVDWPYREYRLHGSFRVDDVTDRTAVLRTARGGHDELWLMNLDDGARRRVLLAATSGGSRWWISGARASDDWVAWEELERGDDLRENVIWRLFAAPVRRPGLKLGTPRLVASASNRQASRPLFDLDGSRLAWVSTVAGAGKTLRSQVMLRDLAKGAARALYTGDVPLGTVGFTDGGRVIVSESPSPGSPAASAGTERILALDAEHGRVDALVDVPSVHGLSHWPAWRHDWLVWAPLPSPDATYPELYLRSPLGRIYGEGGQSVDPCIVGDHLFYQSDRSVAPGDEGVVEVRVLNLSEMRSAVLVAAEVENEIWWRAPVASPYLERRYVVYGDNALAVERSSQVRTRVRVFDLQ